jgi:hypothetical protein
MRKPLPLFEGLGHVRFAGHAGAARYTIQGDPDRLRPGVARLRGSVRLDAELAREAFRAGEGVMVVESGAQLRMIMLAHTPGASDVYVELRA